MMRSGSSAAGVAWVALSSGLAAGVAVSLSPGVARGQPVVEPVDVTRPSPVNMADHFRTGGRRAWSATSLHGAAARLDEKLVRELIAGGADVNGRDERGRTALAAAAGMGPGDPEQDVLLVKVAEALIASGVDVNAADVDGVTALGHAVYWGYDRTATLLRGLKAAEGLERAAVERARSSADGKAYRTYAEIETILTNLAALRPDIARKVVLGTSVQGRNISALRLSDNVGVEEFEPEARYVSTMHGDETVGNEMMLELVNLLVTGYGTDARVTALVNELDLWIVPVMNPDGYVAVRRTNQNGVDLNRSFPDPFTSPVNTTAGRQPETAAMMNWAWSESFALSANFHTGALVVNYPYDNNAAGASVFTPSPDEDVFVFSSLAYSRPNGPMFASTVFPQGITNGADWYIAEGGMQDWMYRYNGCPEVTVELSNTKNPAASTLPGFWSQNRESLLAYLETARLGVKGLVTDASTGEPVLAAVRVRGRESQPVFTDPDVGDYHRILLGGTYELEVSAAGYDTETLAGVVVPGGGSVRADVLMARSPRVLTPNGGEALRVGDTVTIGFEANPSRRHEVQFTLNDGEQATTSDGFERATLGAEYASSSPAWRVVSTGQTGQGAQSAVIGANAVTSMSRTLRGPGQVTFSYWVSSEANYDFLTVQLNGQEIVRRSGTVNWTSATATLAAGDNTLTWSYLKDGSVNSGSDAARVDNINVTADSTVWQTIGEAPVGASGIVWTPAAQSSRARVRVRSVPTAGVAGPWDASDGVFTIGPAVACGADITGDGVLNVFDVFAFFNAFGAGDLGADFAPVSGPDGVLNIFDIFEFFAQFGAGC